VTSITKLDNRQYSRQLKENKDIIPVNVAYKKMMHNPEECKSEIFLMAYFLSGQILRFERTFLH
jgi:hypothetical protein